MMMEFANDWYGRREELEQAIRYEGFEVEESNCEYIAFTDNENDKAYVAYLGGTLRTITVEIIKELAC